MQNWESIPQANYDHNWYGTMFSSIKREPTTPAYNLDHHHIGLGKTTNMDSSFGSPTSPNSHQTSDGLDGHGFCGLNTSNHPLGFNPLTPPGYPNAVIPQINFSPELSYQESSVSSTVATAQSSQNPMSAKMETAQSLTPSHTPPMDITPPKSPKSLPATPEKDNEMSSNSNDSGEDTRFPDSDNDDESISKPKFNSHGKVKKFKCKQCGYIAITKVDFWAHAREHIKPEKLLECHFCPFVTELKHHLEYHIRKHKNLKPFQCDQCSYSCVNKSMLNSHLKSHSKVYQYRCADCDYATKYCHSFKLHLRKYTHKPGMVLNEDGTPNPLIIIDVYGTRRGPKMKGREGNAAAKLAKQEIRNMNQSTQASTKTLDNMNNQSRHPSLMSNQPSNMVSNLLPSTLASMLQQSRNLPFFPYLNLNLQMLAAQQQAVLAQMSPSMGSEHALKEEMFKDERTNRFDSEAEDTLDGSDLQNNNNNNNAMDLTQASPIKPVASDSSSRSANFESEKPFHLNPLENHSTTPVLSTVKTSRRKGRAFKLDAVGNDSDDADEAVQPPSKLLLEDFNDDLPGNRQSASKDDHNDTSEKQRTNSTTPAPPEESSLKLTPKNTYECKSCGIYFRDAVLHTIHMGYHSCDDEFKCNMCGEKCGDRLTFFVHIARFPHS